MVRSYVALGSNLDNPIKQIKTAFIELAALPKTKMMQVSDLYQNPPMDYLDQPDFVNAVMQIETDLSAEELLHHINQIEDDHQRVRVRQNGPRTLDLDLLLYGDEIISSPSLQVPHPRMKERVFVIYPLAQINPHLILPCGTSIQTLLKKFSNATLQVVI